jgi:hypothetical protein
LGARLSDAQKRLFSKEAELAEEHAEIQKLQAAFFNAKSEVGQRPQI